MKFVFPDFAIVQEANAKPEKADVLVRTDEDEVVIRITTEDWDHKGKFCHNFLLIRLWWIFGDRIFGGASEALRKIGNMVSRKKTYSNSRSGAFTAARAAREAARGTLIFDSPTTITTPGKPEYLTHVEVTLHNHDEVGELLLSIAKDLS